MNCIKCKFVERYIRSNTAANSIEKVICKRYPKESEHQSDDWCGEFKEKQNESNFPSYGR